MRAHPLPILALSLSLLLPLPAAGAVEQTLVVGGDADFAPFEYLDDKGRPAGFDVDILRAVVEVMGMQLDLQLGPWEQMRTALEEGRIDALAGMRYSPERDLVLDFSAPYLFSSSAIFVREGSSVESVEDLRGTEILVQHGDIMDDEIHALLPSAHIVLVGSQEEALSRLAAGESDAALCSRLRGLYLVRHLQLDNLRVTGPDLAEGPYGFAVHEGNDALLARLDEGLRLLKTTGRYEAIYERWFGLYEHDRFLRRLRQIGVWVVAPTLLLLIAAIVWSWTLRRQVALRTREVREQYEERRRTEEQLEAERRYRQYVEASPVPMAVIDTDLRILSVNQRFTSLFGYTAEEIPDTCSWWSLACPDEHRRERLLADWQDWFSGRPRELEPFEADVQCRDGTLRHVLCRYSTIDDHHFLVFNDITKRKRAEDALAYRSRMEATISTISTRFVNVASSEVDQEIERALMDIGKVIEVDRSYVFLFSDDGRQMHNTHEWCADGIEPYLTRLQNLPTVDFTVFLNQMKEQGVFYCPSVASLGPEFEIEKAEWMLEGILSIITVPMLQKGKMVGFVGFDSVRRSREWSKEVLFLLRIVGESFANALERRNVEDELRFAHQQMQDIIDFLPDATFVIDQTGTVVAWNRAIEQMTGVPKEEMLGRGDYACALPFYGERRPTLADQLRENNTGEDNDCDLPDARRRPLFVEKFFPHLYNGKGAHVWAMATTLCDQNGNLVGAVEAIRDISDRKRAEEKLEASNRELEAFVYTVSHDLRSPLTPIIGYADLLQETLKESIDSQSLGCLEEISASGNKMLTLLEDLLDLAKVGYLEPPTEPVDVSVVVRDVLEHLVPHRQEQGLQIEVAELPALRLPASLLYQIFSNLIGNALKYAGSPIEIGGEQTTDSVRLFVRDHGPGIPPLEHERIFEVFYRSSEGKKCRGTGIGLATVRKIARLYDGRAWVEETPGGGATFWVEIVRPTAVR